MSLKYFGTDGIRGAYGIDPISESFARKFALGLVRYLKSNDNGKNAIAIGRDTRASGETLTTAFSEIFLEHGFDILDLGVIPTPQVSYAVTQNEAKLGIAITASHNPAEDNGFKLFNSKGTKFTPAEELEIEQQIDSEEQVPKTDRTGSKSSCRERTTDQYFKLLKEHFHQLDLSEMSIAIDTANGATAAITPKFIESLGAKVYLIGNNPNGTNINDGVGSEHTSSFCDFIKEKECDFGFAHDGDGDRVVFVDKSGAPLSGEHFIAIVSKYNTQNKATSTNPLVTTVQSNLALDHFVADLGAETKRTAVGDRNVVYSMLECGASFGAENSGHYVFSDVLPTGDGLVAALKLIQVLKETGKSIESLRKELVLFPSKLVNLKIAEKRGFETLTNLNNAKNDAEKRFNGKGRVLLRYSGTENKIRILVECESEETLKETMDKLIAAAELDLEILT